MHTIRLALRNTLRQPRRTALTVLAIAFAVFSAVFLDAYIAGMFNSVLSMTHRLETGDMKVIPKEGVGRVRPLPLHEAITGAGSLSDSLEAHPAVLQAAPRIRFGVLLDSGDGAVPALGMGLLFSKEGQLMNPGQWVLEGRLPRDDEAAVLIGTALADELGLSLGDEFFFVASTSYGGMGPGLYTVTGLFESGMKELDRKSFMIPLPEVQQQLDLHDAALEILLKLDAPRDRVGSHEGEIQALLNRVSGQDLRALPWMVQGGMAAMLAPADMVEMILMLLLAIIASVTVINTVLMSVMERTREFAALRALGFQRAQVMRMVLVESLLLGVMGTLIGMAGGMALSLWLKQRGMDFSAMMENVSFPLDPVIYAAPDVLTAVKAALLGLFVALIASWYPARVAVRRPPAEAIKAQ